MKDRRRSHTMTPEGNGGQRGGGRIGMPSGNKLTGAPDAPLNEMGPVNLVAIEGV